MKVTVFVAHHILNVEPESGRLFLDIGFDEVDSAEWFCVESIVFRVGDHSQQVSSDALVDRQTEVCVSICVNHCV